MITAFIDFDLTNILSILIPGGFGAIIGLFSKSGQDKAKAEAAKAKAEAAEAEAKAEAAKAEARNEQIKSLESTLEHCLEREHKLHEEKDRLNATIDDKVIQIRKYVEEIGECEVSINTLYERNAELEKEIGELKLELATKRCDELHCPFRVPPTVHTLPHTGESKEQYHANKNAIVLSKSQTTSLT